VHCFLEDHLPDLGWEGVETACWEKVSHGRWNLCWLNVAEVEWFVAVLETGDRFLWVGDSLPTALERHLLIGFWQNEIGRELFPEKVFSMKRCLPFPSPRLGPKTHLGWT
jgi:hypothetical protein